MKQDGSWMLKLKNPEMHICLKNVIPSPMAGEPLDNLRIWGRSVELDAFGSILVKADSGRGKSTLVSFIYGNRRDYAGRIEIDGRDTACRSLDELANCRQAKMSVVFQDLRLFPGLTARQNILLKYQLTPGVKMEELEDWAEKTGMSLFFDQCCGTLSLGQQQRVAILRALVQPFEFLMLDEPFSHLDRRNIDIAYALIRQRCQEQKAGLLMTSLGEDYGIDFTQTLTV
jgi:putative ABC transport system ATP-binding protein